MLQINRLAKSNSEACTGDFTEDALTKIFNNIDSYHAQKDSSMNK